MGDSIKRAAGPPAGFERIEYQVNGIRTVVYCAGEGPPLVYWHGGGTFHGIDFTQPWLRELRVIAPFHPGMGESGDAGPLRCMNDYLLHYRDLFDQMGLDRFHLIGVSLGAWMAAEFAIAHGQLLDRLVLVAPAGLEVPEFPSPDLSTVTPAELPAWLAHDPAVLEPYLPRTDAQQQQFSARVLRDLSAMARVAPEGIYNPSLGQWLHRITMPTLLVWGDQDRMAPVGRVPFWMGALPNARACVVKNAGHAVLDESPAAREAIRSFLVGDGARPIPGTA